jgi:membrane protease subunit (stomatin/prohibitin family)
MIAGGVGLIVAGTLLQAINIQSAASEAPPQFGSSNIGNIAALGMIAGLLVLAGVITSVIGVIRYAQSGGERLASAPAAPVQRPVASSPVATPAYCSSCGAGIVGEGRFCASCGASTAH